MFAFNRAQVQCPVKIIKGWRKTHMAYMKTICMWRFCIFKSLTQEALWKLSFKINYNYYCPTWSFQGQSKAANIWFSLFQLHLLNWFKPSIVIIASVCRLGKNGANIIFYKGGSWESLTRVEGHLQLALAHRKCDGLCSVSNECLILIKIQRFKFHPLKYCECIVFPRKRTEYCTPNSTTKSLLESTSFFPCKTERRRQICYSVLSLWHGELRGKNENLQKMICL